MAATSVSASSNVEVLYGERQRFPWFAALYGASVAECIAAIGIGAALLTGDSFRTIDVIILGAMAAFGGLLGLQTGRRVWLFPEVLRIGWQIYPGGPEVPLQAVTATGVVRGRELWRARFRVSMPRSKSGPLLLGGAVPIPGFGQALVGGYLLATRAIRQGNCCAPGQGPAVFISTPSLATPLWIIGTRNPERFLKAIDDARANLPPPSPNEERPRSQGRWLPPRRER